MKPAERLFVIFYTTYFLAIYLSYLALLLAVLHWRGDAFPISFSTLVLPALELAFMCMLGLCAWYISRGRLGIFALTICLGVPLGATLVYFVQGVSAYLSGSYLSVIALENSSEGQYIRRPELTALGGMGVAAWLLLCVAALRSRNMSASRPGWKFAAGLAVITIAFMGTFGSFPTIANSLGLQKDLAPANSLARRFRELYKARSRLEDTREALRAQGFPISGSRKYPLLHREVYSTSLPFAIRKPAPQKPNVIVIFTEGLSARFLGTYGGRHTGLTPNIDDFASRSMVVDNYFNHTAATFRGLKGQLVSGYPRMGGTEPGGWTVPGEDNARQLTRIRYRTLTDAFTEHGYETAFLSGHTDENPLNTMLRSLRFGTVYSMESLPELLHGAKPALNSQFAAVSDHDLFQGLRGYLENHAEVDEKQKPFFVATYNLGTHAFLDGDNAGPAYQGGENTVLNRIHNFDAQLGKFLTYFEASEFAENTMLIITADHATFPEPPAVKALEDDGSYDPFFVDRIPLIVYNKGLEFPRRFNANDRTSVDFAPTILHLLGQQSFGNSFMGYSLFEIAPAHHVPLAALGTDYYHITGHRVRHSGEIDSPDPRYRAFEDYVRLYQWLEKENRINPPATKPLLN